MGISYRSYVKFMEKAVAKGLPQGSVLNLGRPPKFILENKRSLPTLMHGEKIEFGSIFGAEDYSKTRKVQFPHVSFRPLYSRTLQMIIWTRVSDKAMKEIEQAGGLDEYLMTVDPKYIICDISAILRRKITQAFFNEGENAADVIRETTAENFYLKNVDKESIRKEEERVNVPAEGRRKVIRGSMYKESMINYGPEYKKMIEESAIQFDEHLSIVARREIMEDLAKKLLDKKNKRFRITVSNILDD